jgi:hypothetical protein
MKIPSLDSLSLPQRIVLTVIIVLIVIFCVAAVGLFSGRWVKWEMEGATAGEEPITLYDRDMIGLERKAVDEAFRLQVAQLYQIWMKDDSGQPGRALIGAARARDAYIRVRAALDKREVLIKDALAKEAK